MLEFWDMASVVELFLFSLDIQERPNQGNQVLID